MDYKFRFYTESGLSYQTYMPISNDKLYNFDKKILVESDEVERIKNNKIDHIIKNPCGLKGFWVCSYTEENAYCYYPIAKISPYKELPNNTELIQNLFLGLVESSFESFKKNSDKMHPRECFKIALDEYMEMIPYELEYTFKECIRLFSGHYVQVPNENDWVCIYNRLYFQFIKNYE